MRRPMLICRKFPPSIGGHEDFMISASSALLRLHNAFRQEAGMTEYERIDPGWPRYRRTTFPPAVRRGNLLFISGMTAVNDDGALVGEGDIVAQARFIYARMAQILATAGGSLADVA